MKNVQRSRRKERRGESKVLTEMVVWWGAVADGKWGKKDSIWSE
jgi:hypothetical protein